MVLSSGGLRGERPITDPSWSGAESSGYRDAARKEARPVSAERAKRK